MHLIFSRLWDRLFSWKRCFVFLEYYGLQVIWFLLVLLYIFDILCRAFASATSLRIEIDHRAVCDLATEMTLQLRLRTTFRVVAVADYFHGQLRTLRVAIDHSVQLTHCFNFLINLLLKLETFHVIMRSSRRPILVDLFFAESRTSPQIL